MSRGGGTAIIIEPAMLMGQYPIPSEKIDHLVGMVTHEALTGIPVLAAWKGFRVSQVKVRHRRRAHGVSKYGSGRMLKGFFDFLTAMMLTKYARRPFHIFGLIGFILNVMGLGINAYITVGWFLEKWIENRPTSRVNPSQRAGRASPWAP